MHGEQPAWTLLLILTWAPSAAPMTSKGPSDLDEGHLL